VETSLETTRLYIRPTADDMQRAVDLLSADEQPPGVLGGPLGAPLGRAYLVVTAQSGLRLLLSVWAPRAATRLSPRERRVASGPWM